MPWLRPPWQGCARHSSRRRLRCQLIRSQQLKVVHGAVAGGVQQRLKSSHQSSRWELGSMPAPRMLVPCAATRNPPVARQAGLDRLCQLCQHAQRQASQGALVQQTGTTTPIASLSL
jgi:hypothetical protein